MEAWPIHGRVPKRASQDRERGDKVGEKEKTSKISLLSSSSRKVYAERREKRLNEKKSICSRRREKEKKNPTTRAL